MKCGSWLLLLHISETVLARDSLASSSRHRDDLWEEGGRLWNARKRSFDTKFAPAQTDEENRMTIANMTCRFFTQPLNHFVPRGRSPSYEQRFCFYDDYATDNVTSPILFYTGNESPLEQYINHTGLMWELAITLQARVVFVEHRYEGESLPSVTSECLSYASTIQALADYANILEQRLNPGNTAPVVVFGGSYGGMLSGWMRMKYPHLVAGAIAASAPIGAFPQPAMNKVDGSARVLTAALAKNHPPDANSDKDNHCPSNLLAAWPLITWLVQQQQQDNGAFLQSVFRLCEPVAGDAQPLLQWAQSIWFDLAEGSFPYPSSYIPFALIHKKVNLPAWPMQAACWKSSALHKDWGVQFLGDTESVNYRVVYGDSGVALDVDWDKVSLVNTSSSFSLETSKEIVGLLTSVRDAVSIWYNITKDMECYNVTQPAPNLRAGMSTKLLQERQLLRQNEDPSKICHDKMKRVGSWEPLCCNDEMNLVITAASGIGHDFFWPPSHPRGTKTYSDVIRNVTSQPCLDPDGIFGYSKEPYELMSTWLDTYYGGVNMDGHSNIVFSNGLLDPWSAGGIYGTNPFETLTYDGPMVQNITETDVLALIIESGGHHTDLMYTSEVDPECVKKARRIEKDYVAKWIADFNANKA